MEISTLSRQILRELCTNSRVTITELAKKYKISRHIATERIKALEREFGLYYTIEPNYEALGFSTMHVLRIKFDSPPKAAEMREIFQKSKIAQLVFTTKGDFDAVIIAVGKSSIEYAQWETALNAKFAKYGISLRTSEVNVMHLGFVPLDPETIMSGDIDPLYKKMLAILTSNSRISIRDLSKQLGVSDTLTRYHFMGLEKTKYIKRFTAIVTKSPLKSNIVYFGNYTIKSGVEKRVERERKSMYWKPLDEFPIVSEYPMMFSTSGGDRSFSWANYSDYKEGLKLSVQAHAAAFREDSPVMTQAVVEEIIKGHPPIRNLDQKEALVAPDWYSEII